MMDGLSGSVIVTPFKEGSVFTPAARTVTGADSNINFTEEPDDEFKIKETISKLFEYFETEEIELLLDLFDYTQFDETREEMLSNITADFAENSYDVKTITYLNLFEISGNDARVGLQVEIDWVHDETNQRTISSDCLQMRFAKRDSKWLIAQFMPYTQEEDVIYSKTQAFLNALQDENLESLQALISDTAILDYGTYDEFVTNWTELLETMDIVEFSFTGQDTWREGDYYVVHMSGKALVNENGIGKAKVIYFWFVYEEFAGDWLITKAGLGGLRYNI